ncbi:MAG: hypothetical protein LBU91_01500 [Bacteroidales bacterium]|jgi:hypothetical protein|nr:hypothetical protein [Bacteroidales bacterium]
MKQILFGIFALLFISMQAQDPFVGLMPRQRLLPNQFIVDQDDIRIRQTVEGKMNTFVILKSNLFEFVYDEQHPLGHIVYVGAEDTAAIYRLGEIYIRGKYAATRNYKKYTPPAVTTLVLSAIPFAGPILGLGWAIPASLTPVKIENLGHPELPLVEHRLYYQGYSEEARRIKARRIWLNFGVGFGICIGTIFVNEMTEGALFDPIVGKGKSQIFKF